MTEQGIVEILKMILLVLVISAAVVGGGMAILMHLKNYMNRLEARNDRRSAEIIHEQNQKDHIRLLELQREIAAERQELLREKISAFGKEAK